MYKRILVPLDGSAPSQRALTEAIALSREAGGTLQLVHVALIPMTPNFAAGLVAETDTIADAIAQAGSQALAAAQATVEKAGVAVETRLLGPQVDAIAPTIADAAQAWRADLIVMGTHGRHGLDHMLLGSVAEQLVRVAPVPVLLVRPGA